MEKQRPPGEKEKRKTWVGPATHFFSSSHVVPVFPDLFTDTQQTQTISVPLTIRNLNPFLQCVPQEKQKQPGSILKFHLL